VSKKTNFNKKVSIKLEPGQSFMLEDLDLFVHVQKTYALILRGKAAPEEKAICNRVIAAVNSAIGNVNNASSMDYDN